MPQNLRKAFGHTRGFVRAAFGSHILNDQISARRILRQNHTKEIVKKQQQSDFVSGSDGKPWLAVAFEWSAQQQAEYKLTLPTFALMQWRPTKCRHATMFHLQIKHDQLCDSMNGMHMSAAQFICMHACAGRFGPDPTWPPHPHSLEIADPHQGAHQTPSTHLHTPTGFAVPTNATVGFGKLQHHFDGLEGCVSVTGSNQFAARGWALLK